MDDLHLATKLACNDTDTFRPLSLQRSHSWPPALSVGTSDFPTVSVSQATSLPPRPELVRRVSSGDSIAAFESIASHSSSDLSLVSEVRSVEQKKEGFRAIVSKRWIQTKQVLHEKAKLYREQHRARHHGKALDVGAEDIPASTAVDEMGSVLVSSKSADRKTTGREDTAKAEHDKTLKKELKRESEKKVHDKKDAERRDSDVKDDHKRGHEKEPAKREPQRKDTGKVKGSKSLRKEKITNPPHELSSVLSQFSVDESRGRRGIPNSYPSAFSSHGELLYDAYRQRKRQSRTSSGRRHSWREPSNGIVPVYEETASIREATDCGEGTAETRPSGMMRGRKSTL